MVVLALLLLFLPKSGEAALLQISGTQFKLEKVSENTLSPFTNCNLLFQGLTSVISSANKQFMRRGWSEDFLKERLGIAEKFSDRSRYYAAFPGMLDFDDITRPDIEYVATIGVTTAKYGSDATEILPLEDTLKIRIPRDGKGLIIEARTYSKAKRDGINLYPLLLNYLIDTAARAINESGDHSLFDKPIIYLYGDDVSIRFYSGFGFRLVEEIPPVEHDGTQWRVMATSLRDLEKLFYNDKTEIAKIPQTWEFQKASALPRLEPIVFSQPTEVRDGIVAAPGSSITYINGKLALSNIKLWKDAYFPELNQSLPAGTFVSFFQGKLHSFANLTRPIILISSGKKLAPGEYCSYPAFRVAICHINAVRSTFFIPNNFGSFDGILKLW